MTDTPRDKTPPKQLVPHLWKPGVSPNPNGRPKGARSKLDEKFVRALYEDFKKGGVKAIAKCREDKPDVYLGVIAKILPKQIDIKGDESLADLADGLHAIAAFLGGFATEDSSADPEGLVPDGSVLSADARPSTH